MTVQVRQPQKSNDVQQALQIAGLIGGGIAGGPSGALAGAQVGGMVGGMVDQGGAGGAVERRLAGGGQEVSAAPQAGPVPSADIEALQNARIALQSQPPDVQKQFGPALQAAMLKANRGVA